MHFDGSLTQEESLLLDVTQPACHVFENLDLGGVLNRKIGRLSTAGSFVKSVDSGTSRA
jgi:hypothetical protein